MANCNLPHNAKHTTQQLNFHSTMFRNTLRHIHKICNATSVRPAFITQHRFVTRIFFSSFRSFLFRPNHSYCSSIHTISQRLKSREPLNHGINSVAVVYIHIYLPMNNNIVLFVDSTLLTALLHRDPSWRRTLLLSVW